MKTIKNEATLITPEKAQQFMLKNTYPGQRPIKEAHVRRYMNDLKKDKFGVSQITFGRVGSKASEILLDGQHRCEAIIISGIAAHANVVIEECINDLELSERWRKYDGGISRSYTDMATSEANILGLDWKTGVSALVGSAAAFLIKARAMHKSDKTELIRSNIDQGNFVNAILPSHSASPFKHLRRYPVVAAMISTYNSDPTKAKEFWEQVKTGEMLTQTDPAWHLRTFLMNYTSISGVDGLIQLRRGENKRISRNEVYNRCIKAWNKFKNSQEIKRFTYQPIDGFLKAA